MINIEKAKQVFLDYVSNYDETNTKINRKKQHSLRTAEVARKIATEINLEQKDIELAELIGLLHDIGRFNQIKIYDTYNDSKSINHAEESVRVLFEENHIRDYIESNEYDNIIKTAIANHNKAKIDDDVDGKELLHSKIIRDADKTDIYETFDWEVPGKTIYNYEQLGQETISDIVLEQIKEHKQLDRKTLQNRLERYISMLSFVFDYNYKPGLKIVKQKEYISRMIKRIENKTEENIERLQEIQEIILKYIDSKLAEEK